MLFRAMAGRDQAIDDRVHDIAMGGEKFAARRGNLDADFVVRRNERRPRRARRSAWPVTARTSRFTIARTTAGSVR